MKKYQIKYKGISAEITRNELPEIPKEVESFNLHNFWIEKFTEEDLKRMIDPNYSRIMIDILKH